MVYSSKKEPIMIPCRKIRFLTIIMLLLSGSSSHSYVNDSTANQLISYKLSAPDSMSIMTTSFGTPIPFEDTVSINTRLLLNRFFLESMVHLARERISERVVHAKGAGAFGQFTVTDDLSDICIAKVFDTIGKKTPVVVRFSSVIQRPGAPDTTREVRGFAVKFYTEEGNFDYVGISFEMFQMKDPIAFPTFVHAFHKNPATQVFDANSKWDFLTLRPESLNMAMRTYGDRGIPDGFRHMPSFTIHTFELTNDLGERTFVRFHLLPDLGIKNLTSAQAKKIQSEDVDYAARDLYNAIANKNYPTWTLSVQTIPENEMPNVNFDIFDVTRFWPVDDFPLRRIGKLKLNRNPKNHFADIEQLAFNPGNLVPGIRGSDTLFEARVLAYTEAHLYRLGVNFNQIRVNCPFKTTTRTYYRDGRAPVSDNEEDAPNYYPNSFHGPVPYLADRPRLKTFYTDPSVNNFDQASYLYLKMSERERCRLIENIAADLCDAENFLQERALKLLRLIHTDLGDRVQYSLEIMNNGSYVSDSCENCSVSCLK